MGAAGLQVAESRVHKLLSLEHTGKFHAIRLWRDGRRGRRMHHACTGYCEVCERAFSPARPV